MFKRHIALSTLLLAASVNAEDWRIVNWNEEFVLYVDHDTIRKVGGTAAYASKVVFLKDESLSELYSKVEVRCGEHLYRNLAVSAVSKAGRTQSTKASKASKAWRQVGAGTNVEREMRNVCI